MEEKADKMLAVNPRYTDDLAHRIEFFKRFFPEDYAEQNALARGRQAGLPPDAPDSGEADKSKLEPPKNADGKPQEPPPARFPSYKLKTATEASELAARIKIQLKKDEARLRAIQNPDGSWGFDPGKPSETMFGRQMASLIPRRQPWR
jgi:hypothetical protein